MDEEEVSPGTGTAIASKDALLERRDSTGRDPQSPQSGGFDLDPQGELDYEELLGSGEEPHLGKDPLESSVNPLESGEDPLENGEPPVHQSKEGVPVDEYEVKIHALEDIEEGEVTSDEEGEIKESDDSDSGKRRPVSSASKPERPAVRSSSPVPAKTKASREESSRRSADISADKEPKKHREQPRAFRRREYSKEEGSDSEESGGDEKREGEEGVASREREKGRSERSRRGEQRSSSVDSGSESGSSDRSRRRERGRGRSRHSSSRSRSHSRSGLHRSSHSKERYQRRSRDREDRGKGFEDKIPTVCRHYLNGKCSWGSSCRFMHERTPKHDRDRMLDPPYLRGPLPPPRGSPMHDVFPPGFRHPLQRDGPPFMPGLPPHMVPSGRRPHPRDMGFPPLHDGPFPMPPPPFPPLGKSSNVAEVAEESDGWFRLRTVTTEWDSDEEDDKKAVEEKIKGGRDSSDSEGVVERQGEGAKGRGGKERDRKKRRNESSLDAQWDSNADSAPEEKTKKAKKGSSNRREKSPTHTAASSRRRKQPIPISADSDQGNSGRDSSAEERQKASRRLAKKAKKSSRDKKLKQQSSVEAEEDSDWSFGGGRGKKRHKASTGIPLKKRKRKAYSSEEEGRKKSKGSKSKRARSVESSSEDDSHRYDNHVYPSYLPPHLPPPFPPYPPHPGEHWPPHHGHTSPHGRAPHHYMDPHMGSPFTPHHPPPMLHQHFSPRETRDQFGRDISKRIEYEELKYQRKTSPDLMPTRDSVPTRGRRSGFDPGSEGRGGRHVPRSYSHERRYSSSNDKSRSITPGASSSSEWEESEVDLRSKYILRRLPEENRKRVGGDGQLTRKEKLMLELQTIEQKLSSRSLSRKTKLLSELKAIDRAIEKKSKKLGQQ